MTYRRELDGLRAIAVLAVILAHAGVPMLQGGFVGVDIFFVLSGYLIGSLILRDLEAGRFSFARFYERRARRILPALLFMLVSCWPLAWWLMTPSELEDFAPGVLASLLFVSNVYFWDVTGYFSPLSESLPLLHTWSLSIEEQYYLLFPVIAILCFRWGGARAVFGVVLLLALLSLILAEWGVRNEPDINYFFTLSRVWEILAGVLCIWIERRSRAHGSDVFATIGLAGILLTIVAFDAATPFPSLYALLPIGGTMLVLIYARDGTRLAELLSLKVFTSIGLISYSAYLFHQPVFAFARIGLDRHLLGALALPLILVVLTFAWVSWRFVEQPFRKGGGQWRLSGRGAGLLGGCVATALGAVSVVIYTTDAALTRYALADRPMFEVSRRDALSYMRSRAADYRNASFVNDGRPRVFIVGDSYASDFVNVLGEAGVLGKFDLSIHVIPFQCGNLMLDADTGFPPQPLPATCKDRVRYDAPSVRNRMRAADVILLISDWREAFVPFLEESLDNIRDETEGVILVFGTKDLGDVAPEALLDVSKEERNEARVQARRMPIATNNAMAALELEGFIDVQSLMCDGDGRTCPVLGPDGRLLSVDGRHLTRSGAQYLGERLLADRHLRKALGL